MLGFSGESRTGSMRVWKGARRQSYVGACLVCRLPFLLPFLEHLLTVVPLPCRDEVAELVSLQG